MSLSPSSGPLRTAIPGRFFRTVVHPVLPLFILVPLACGSGEQSLRVLYLKSECDYCRMLFQDRSFGAQMQLENDSIRVFDDPECLAAFLITNRIPESRIRMIWTVDYGRPPFLVDAREAVFLRTKNVLSPMGVNIAAFGTKAEADSAYVRMGGEIMDWEGVVRYVRQLWFHGRGA